jgi:hypothetical protein
MSPLDRKSRKKSDLILPPGWLHVSGNTATALVFEMDLCEECKKIVMEIAGKARTSHTTSSKAPEKPEGKKAKAAGKGDKEETKEGKQESETEPLRLVETG